MSVLCISILSTQLFYSCINWPLSILPSFLPSFLLSILASFFPSLFNSFLSCFQDECPASHCLSTLLFRRGWEMDRVLGCTQGKNGSGVGGISNSWILSCIYSFIESIYYIFWSFIFIFLFSSLYFFFLFLDCYRCPTELCLWS